MNDDLRDQLAQAIEEEYARLGDPIAAADAILARFAVAGELPEVTDTDDGVFVHIPEIDRWADIQIRRSDGRIGYVGISNPIREHAHVLPIAAALIAAYRHTQETRS